MNKKRTNFKTVRLPLDHGGISSNLKGLHRYHNLYGSSIMNELPSPMYADIQFTPFYSAELLHKHFIMLYLACSSGKYAHTPDLTGLLHFDSIVL